MKRRGCPIVKLVSVTFNDFARQPGKKEKGTDGDRESYNQVRSSEFGVRSSDVFQVGINLLADFSDRK